MNNARRKMITEALDMLYRAKDILDMAREEEEEYRDNMPENLTSSERYEKADNAVYELEDAVDSLEDMTTRIEEAIE